MFYQLRKHLNPDTGSLCVGLEKPLPYQVLGEEIEIRGWAFSGSGDAVQARVLIDGVRAVPIEFSETRIDVLKSFDLPASSARVGFRQLLRWSDISEDSDVARVSCEFTDARTSFCVGPLLIYRAGREAAAQRFFFHLDRPTNGEIVSGDVVVSGWAFSLDDLPVRGRIFVESEERGMFAPAGASDIRFELQRPDVECLFDELERGHRVGFEERFSWRDFGADCGRLRLGVELVHGRELFSFGPFEVKSTGCKLLRHQRGSYKEVWTAAASDPRSAMATVAATSDEEDFMSSGASTARTIGEALDISKNDVVLEIGCGVGRIGYFLAPVSAKWIGTDISPGMLDYARKRLGGFSNVELHELDSCSLDGFADSSIDKLYCSTVFMHLDEWDRYAYVAEAYRVLRPGGLCYFDNVNLAGAIGWEVFCELLNTDAAKRSPAASKPSTREELEVYLRKSGFVDIRARVDEHYVAVMGRRPC